MIRWRWRPESDEHTAAHLWLFEQHSTIILITLVHYKMCLVVSQLTSKSMWDLRVQFMWKPKVTLTKYTKTKKNKDKQKNMKNLSFFQTVCQEHFRWLLLSTLVEPWNRKKEKKIPKQCRLHWIVKTQNKSWQWIFIKITECIFIPELNAGHHCVWCNNIQVNCSETVWVHQIFYRWMKENL